MGSEQEEDAMLVLPKAQLGNMLASHTLDFTVTEMHGRTPKTSSSLFPVYCIFLECARIGIRMTVWIHRCTVCVVVSILVA